MRLSARSADKIATLAVGVAVRKLIISVHARSLYVNPPHKWSCRGRAAQGQATIGCELAC